MLKQWIRTTVRRLMPVALVLMVAATPAMADSRVGVVDLRQALFSSDGARSFSEQLQREFTDAEQDVRSAQDEARRLQERLQRDGAMMSERERERLTAEFQEKVQNFSIKRDELDQAVNARKQAFLEEARPEVDRAIKELMDEHDLDVILPTEAVVYIRPQFNLTQELLEKLNR